MDDSSPVDWSVGVGDYLNDEPKIMAIETICLNRIADEG